MSSLGLLFVLIFYATPIFIIVWAFKTSKLLGKKPVVIATAAMVAWLIKAVWVYHGAMSCLGGHCVKAGEEYKNIIEAVAIIGVDVLIMVSLYIFYMHKRKHT